jgi:hypothetical protein
MRMEEYCTYINSTSSFKSFGIVYYWQAFNEQVISSTDWNSVRDTAYCVGNELPIIEKFFVE